MISDTMFFVVAKDSSGDASYIVVDAPNRSADWNKLLSTSFTGDNTFYDSAAILNETEIHSVIIYGDRRLVLTTLNANDGSLIGDIYASNVTGCTQVADMRLNRDKIYILST